MYSPGLNDTRARVLVVVPMEAHAVGRVVLACSADSKNRAGQRRPAMNMSAIKGRLAEIEVLAHTDMPVCTSGNHETASQVRCNRVESNALGGFIGFKCEWHPQRCGSRIQ